MGKAILYAYFEGDIDRLTALHLLKQGHILAIHAVSSDLFMDFFRALAPDEASRCFFLSSGQISPATASAMVEEARLKTGGLDLLILGCREKDEGAFLNDAQILGEELVAEFTGTFLIAKEACRFMMRQKTGQIIFLLFQDALYYAGYPSAPVLSEGRRAFLRSLAKEMTPFYINVNALIFGVIDSGLAPREKKKIRKKLEIFALKPPLPKWDDVSPFLDLLVSPPVRSWTGQLLYMTPCGE